MDRIVGMRIKNILNSPCVGRSLAFTMAEVLITITLVGIVAAITIPSVINSTQQVEFRTGLKKAIAVLNAAIEANISEEGQSPYETGDLYGYLTRHMNVMRSKIRGPRYFDSLQQTNKRGNVSFYTVDGMRFEFIAKDTKASSEVKKFVLWEAKGKQISLRGSLMRDPDSDSSSDIGSYLVCGSKAKDGADDDGTQCGFCGSACLSHNPYETKHAPCLIVVDVNGDRGPYPKDAYCFEQNAPCISKNVRKYANPTGTRLTDTFPVMITDWGAVPYGYAAQRAMYSGKHTEFSGAYSGAECNIDEDTTKTSSSSGSGGSGGGPTGPGGPGGGRPW